MYIITPELEVSKFNLIECIMKVNEEMEQKGIEIIFSP